MEAAKRPRWEFGSNRVKAVGDDPRILIDSANAHTLCTRRGLMLACMCETLLQGPANTANCWHAQQPLDGTDEERLCLAPAANICSHRETMDDAARYPGGKQSWQAHTFIGFASMKWRQTTHLQPQEGWLENAAPMLGSGNKIAVSNHGPLIPTSVGPQSLVVFYTYYIW